MVSTICCIPREQLTFAQLIAQTFPAGSITGTPKHAAMRFIDQQEDFRREVYTGAVGYIDQHGGCRLSVAIRNACLQAGRLEYFAGGGHRSRQQSRSRSRRNRAQSTLLLRGHRHHHRRGPRLIRAPKVSAVLMNY